MHTRAAHTALRKEPKIVLGKGSTLLTTVETIERSSSTRIGTGSWDLKVNNSKQQQHAELGRLYRISGKN